MRLSRTISCVLLALALFPAAVLAARGDELVHATLLSDVSAIQPGESFRLGVLLKIDPGWHIYWKNPGDSGLPTRVKLDLPSGFTAGDVQYPVPAKLLLPGDIINYGYEDEVMLIVPIKPAKDLPAGSSVEIRAKMTWLVCQEICLPGKAETALELPIARHAQPASGNVFDRWSQLMPAADAEQYVNPPSPQNVVDASANSAHRHFDFKLTWKRPVTDVDWMPEKNDPAAVRNAKVQTRDGTTLLSFDVEAGDAPRLPKAIRSLLVFKDSDGQRHGVELTFPLPALWDGINSSAVPK